MIAVLRPPAAGECLAAMVPGESPPVDVSAPSLRRAAAVPATTRP